MDIIEDAFETVDSEYGKEASKGAREAYESIWAALGQAEKAMLLFCDPFGNVGDFERWSDIRVTGEMAREISLTLKAIKKAKEDRVLIL